MLIREQVRRTIADMREAMLVIGILAVFGASQVWGQGYRIYDSDGITIVEPFNTGSPGINLPEAQTGYKIYDYGGMTIMEPFTKFNLPRDTYSVPQRRSNWDANLEQLMNNYRSTPPAPTEEPKVEVNIKIDRYIENETIYEDTYTDEEYLQDLREIHELIKALPPPDITEKETD